MRRSLASFALVLALTASGAAFAKTADKAPPAPAPTQAPAQAPAPTAPPRLVVAISVDQFSADLFARYRRYFTAGLARLQEAGERLAAGTTTPRPRAARLAVAR